MKGIVKIIGYILVSLFLLTLTFLGVMQMPSVQTGLAQKAVELVRGSLDGDIDIESIHIRLANTVVLKNVTVKDRCPCSEIARDTLFHADLISVRFSMTTLLSFGHVRLKHVQIRNGCFNLVVDGNPVYGNNLSRIFNLVPKDTPEEFPTGNIIRIDRISFDNMAFAMQNFVAKIETANPWNVNWSDLDVKHIDLDARDFAIRSGRFFGKIKRMSFEEKSGWKITQLSAKAEVGQGNVIVDDIALNDCFGSDLSLDFKMLGRQCCYEDFVNKVFLVADIRPSRLCLATLARVIPPLNPCTSTFATLKGNAKGTVSCIQADNLDLRFEDNSFRALVNGQVSGLPDVKRMDIDTDISGVVLNTADATALLKAIAPRAGVDLRSLSPGVSYGAHIRTNGTLNSFDVSLGLSQGRQDDIVNADVQLCNLLEAGKKQMGISGRISTENFDLSEVLGSRIADDIKLSTNFDLKLPFARSPLSIKVDSLKIDGAILNGSDYCGIRGNASLSGDNIEADILFRDNAFDADLGVRSDEKSYTANLVLKRADLHEMGLDKRQISLASAKIFARLDKNIKELQGNGTVSDIFLVNEDGGFDVGDIEFNAYRESYGYMISLTSTLAEGAFFGDLNRFKAGITLNRTHGLTSFLKPGFYIEKGTQIQALRDSAGVIHARLNSGRIALQDNYVKDLSADIEGPADSLCAKLTAPHILAAGLDFNDVFLNAAFKRGHILDIKADYGHNGDQEIEGNLNASLDFKQAGALSVNIEPSYARMQEEVWRLPSSSFSLDGGKLAVDSLILANGDRRVLLDGALTNSLSDTLKAEIRRLNLERLSVILNNGAFALKGKINGDVQLMRSDEEGFPRLLMDIEADSLSARGTDYGSIRAFSEFDRSKQYLEIGLMDVIGDRNALLAKMQYVPESEAIEMTATMDRMPIDFLGGFTEGIFSRLGGLASGNVKMSSQEGSPLDLSCSDGHIESGLLEVAFTHVPYNLDGDFTVDGSGIHLKNMKVTDRFNGRAEAKGGLKWKKMKNMRLELDMDAHSIEALAIPSGIEGSGFYGDVTASGKVGINGPFNKLLLTADCVTSGPSQMHFVISDDMDASKGNLLTFIDQRMKVIDPYDSLMAAKKVKTEDNTGFKLKIKAEANQNFKAFLDMGGSSFAAGATAIGSGKVNLDVDTGSGNFSILGDYILQSGTFDFNASNIVHREFTIEDGSSVRFGGPIEDISLNVTADYQTKASISTLIADTSSVSNRRTVLCGIKLKDKLSDPSLSFSIDIPDLDPSVASAVRSALSTEEKVQKQFLSLLISNTFLPDEQSGIFNNSAIISSNVSELMANQINNIFTKLDIPLDLGLNYQSGSSGEDLFDVALSTQLWDNRVIIGGSIGNKQSKNSSSGTVFGDLDIEYKVTRNGAFRIKAFSHSADQYSNYLDQSQRNGLGVTWQQEFDDFCKMMRFLFYNKQQRIQYLDAQSSAEKKTRKIVLDE